MKVALTGAAGHLGAAVLQELLLKKFSVKALVRDPRSAALKSQPVELIHGDLFQQETREQLMEGCDAVIHCAALISVNGDPHGLVHKTNVTGTRIALETARNAGVKRFIQISSIHAYRQEPCFSALNEEREPVDTDGFAYDLSKQAGKELALAANNKDFEVLVLHPTAIIGPHDHKPSRMGKVIMDLYRGRLPFIFNGGFDFCDSRDVATAAVNALHKGTPGEAYLLSGKWHSLKELAQMLSQATGKHIKPVCLSPAVAKMGLPFVTLLSRLQKKEPLYSNEALVALFSGNRYICSDKASEKLDYQTRPLSETIRDTIAWFQNNNYLDKV